MKKEIWLVIILAAVIIVLVGFLMWPSNKPNNNSDIKDLSIESGQKITNPLTVQGQARGSWFFEGSFPIKITDEKGNVLGSSFVTAQGEWMTENFVPFKGETEFASSTGGKGFLVLSKDNPSGLPEYDKQIKIPITFDATGYTKIKVFFNNNKLDPEISCNKVFPVEREILKIDAIGAAAINQLLMGPTNEDQKAGYFTSINTGVGVTLQSLNIDKNGTARVDFNEKLEEGVGGSCKVSAIRAQITETLKQFPTIKNVIISVNGRTEDILQP